MLQKIILPVLLFLLAFLSGCSAHLAPIDSRAQPPSIYILTHQVAKGETLYSIAWRYDLDFRLLAKANRIGPPYTLSVGQQLNLHTADVMLDTSVKQPAASTKAADKRARRPAIGETPQPTPVVVTRLKPIKYSKNLRWQWPVKGKVVESYHPQDLRKGIKIKAKSGSNVLPAAQGTVVYAGDGLRSYGKLIIIKHSEILMSAYGHNEKMMVKEGQFVKTTQVIAKLSSEGLLYFEVRKDGYPVNPVVYID